jgi:endonuclease YncB( thermonuclease family)
MPGVGGEVVTVARVVDGDTFELTDGRKVRVLGIDSCKMGTYGEQAKSAADLQLTSTYSTVTLTSEPGVETDQYGRLLRYVDVDGADFGLDMVGWDHASAATTIQSSTKNKAGWGWMAGAASS